MDPGYNACLNQHEDLLKTTQAVNQAAFETLGFRNSCIASANALHHILTLRCYESRIVRVEATIFAKDLKIINAVFLGALGDGTRRAAAKKGMWHGHVAVLVDNTWMCDSTLDQIVNPGLVVPPIVFKLDSLDPKQSTQFEVNNCNCRYRICRKQTGFKNAPDSRRSHWMDIVTAVGDQRW